MYVGILRLLFAQHSAKRGISGRRQKKEHVEGHELWEARGKNQQAQWARHVGNLGVKR